MNSIFKPYLRKFVLVFFDDILIYSSDFSSHLDHLAKTLKLLQENQLHAKLSKCEFATTKIEYLGHVITSEGVSTDPKKIADMINWPIPKTVKDLRGFLGLTGYFRKFVTHYGIISIPLTDLLKKDAFKWGPEPQAAFDQLKQAMSTAPVLTLPDFSQPFTVETDASQFGIGAVLMQNKRPIAYLSQKLGSKNQGLSTYEKALLALISAVTKWRLYLIGSTFTIKTDQISLKHLLEQKIHTALQHRGLSKLLGFHYTIEYKKGVENKVADALSRRDGPNGEYFVLSAELNAFSELIPQWVTDIKESYKGDTWIEELLLKLKNAPPDKKQLTLHQGILRRDGRICVGNNGIWRQQLLK